MYLTSIHKKYYLEDFEKLLRFEKEDSIWPLDSGLQDVLTFINSNSKIQTLYSKKYSPKPDVLSPFPESYLQIAYTEEVESLLEAFLKSLKNHFKTGNIKLTIERCEPEDNANYNPNSSIDLGCIKNKDYFRLYHFKIHLEASDIEVHNDFYKKLQEISNLV